AAWQIATARDEAASNEQTAIKNAQEKTRLAEEKAHLADSEHEARTRAEEAQRENQRLLVSGFVANGNRALEGGDPFGSLVWYGEALRRDPAHEDAHRVRLAGVLRRCPRLVQVWFGNETAPPAISPDGSRVLLTQKDVTRIWDVATGELAAPMKH